MGISSEQFQFITLFYSFIQSQKSKIKQMEALKKFHKSVRQSKSLKQFIDNLENLAQIFITKSPQQFSQSRQLENLCAELQKMKLKQIEENFKQLPVLPDITAIIVKSSKSYTLALLMIPQGKYFGWHDHNQMNGVSRIVSGQLKIRSLNPEHLKLYAQDIYLYPVDRIRQQILKTNEQNLSIIYPDSFNIHQITGIKQSCFLDLLIPEYPDNSCHYFQTCDEPIVQGETEDKIKIRKVVHSCEQIIGLETLAKVFKEKQKQKQVQSKNTKKQVINLNRK